MEIPKAVAVTKDLVDMLDEATEIVDFFKKQDEIKAVKKKIKRELLETSFDDEDLRKAVMDRFMQLAKVKFGK
jgi:type I restriction enzyme R subunit